MIRGLLTVVICSFTPACISVKPVYFDGDKRMAQAAVEKFHKDYNDKAFEQIFDAAHAEAKATKSKDALINVLTQIQSTLGRHIYSRLIKSTVAVANPREREVDMLFRARFEKGEVNEFFLVLSNGSEAHI